jgi:hypothetical protein
MLPDLVIGTDLKFADVMRPLAAEVAPCFWLVDHESGGPFGSLLVGRNEALLEKQRFDVAVCHNTDCSCWRPHTFPRLAEHLRLDEYTHFFALRSGEDEVREWAEQYARRLTHEFGRLEQQADLHLIYGDGWWEMYTPHADWHRNFREAFPKFYKRSCRKAGQPPTDYRN